MSEKRAQRFDKLIKQELGKIIFNFLDTRARRFSHYHPCNNQSQFILERYLYKHLSFKRNPEILNNLNKSIYQIQQLLNKKLKVRPVPKIIFKFDKNPEEASRIEKLIEEIKEK